MAGFDMTLQIEAGKAVLTSKTSAEADATTVNADTALVDGALELSAAGVKVTSLQLMDDGTIAFVFSLGQLEMSIYMAPAAAVEEPAA